MPQNIHKNLSILTEHNSVKRGRIEERKNEEARCNGGHQQRDYEEARGILRRVQTPHRAPLPLQQLRDFASKTMTLCFEHVPVPSGHITKESIACTANQRE